MKLSEKVLTKNGDRYLQINQLPPVTTVANFPLTLSLSPLVLLPVNCWQNQYEAVSF